MSEAALIYTTWPDGESAAAAAALLLEDKLIACANILAAGRSLYRWEGETCAEAETVMLLKTVAEGVETKEQLALLRDEGATLAQGFLFSRPIPAAEFEAFMRQPLEARRSA